MKTKLTLLALVTLSTFNSPLSTAVAQGSLTPPAGAPAPVMKSLNQIEPRTPISAASFVISQPGSYYLTTNITGAGFAPGVTIATNDVTLDLNGFVVTGPASVYAGVFVSGSFTNVTVRNGAIKGWIEGVRVIGDNAQNIALEHLNISDSFGYGIDCKGATVTACSITGTANTGIYAVNSRIQNCAVNRSRAHGIELRSSDLIDSRVVSSARSGVFINFAGCQVIGNTFRLNNASNAVADASIFINDSYNRIENNHVSGSGPAGSGIGGALGYTGNIIIRNSVTGGGGTPYFSSGGQIGPIITGVGTITNLNPWANFSN